MTERGGTFGEGATKSGATVLCCSVFEEGGTFNSTKGRVTVRVGDGGVNKAKVYESKGTPNYRYTIHD